MRATTANISALALRLSKPDSNAPSSAAFMMLPACRPARGASTTPKGPAARAARSSTAVSGRPGPNFFINGMASASSQRNGPLAMRSNFCSGGQANRVLTRLKKQPNEIAKASSPICAGV